MVAAAANSPGTAAEESGRPPAPQARTAPEEEKVRQAGAAGGYLGMVEAMRQVLGEALGAQVEGAHTALVSGFGMINFDRGLCSGAAILAGEQSS